MTEKARKYKNVMEWNIAGFYRLGKETQNCGGSNIGAKDMKNGWFTDFWLQCRCCIAGVESTCVA